MKSSQRNDLKRKKRIARQYSARLMNNTKWREVFKLLSEYEVHFKISWIDSPRIDPYDGSESESSYNAWPIEAGDIADDHIKDGGFVGGPFFYEEIALLEIPCELKKGEYYFTKHEEIVNNLSALLADLNRIGQLPLELVKDRIIISAYTAENETAKDKKT